MGEAKRRKQKDPNFGSYTPNVTIQESPMTNNFLVMVEDHCVDSTIHIEEAEAIKQWIETEHQLNPMKRQDVKSGHLHQWMINSPRKETYPETTAEILVIDTTTGKVSTERLTV